jgi:hypothetical protein
MPANESDLAGDAGPPYRLSTPQFTIGDSHPEVLIA